MNTTGNLGHLMNGHGIWENQSMKAQMEQREHQLLEFMPQKSCARHDNL